MMGEGDSRLPTVRSAIEIIPPGRDVMLQQFDRWCRSIGYVGRSERDNLLVISDDF